MREWLYIARAKKNLTQKEMAKRMSCTEAYYSLIENGKRQNPMDLQTVWRLSKALGMTTKEIVDKELCDLC